MVTCLTGNSRSIYCGTSSGYVVLRDTRSPVKGSSDNGSLQRSIAHGGALSSIDAKGDLLITCGETGRPGYITS